MNDARVWIAVAWRALNDWFHQWLVMFMIIGAVIFFLIDMPFAMGMWFFAAGSIHENRRLRSYPHLIAED